MTKEKDYKLIQLPVALVAIIKIDHPFHASIIIKEWLDAAHSFNQHIHGGANEFSEHPLTNKDLIASHNTISSFIVKLAKKYNK